MLDPDDALAAASWLDRCLNNTSLVFVVEIEDVRIVFPGDAQWGVWREILANTDARALLERATLYKVSHHGSHNGSPKTLVHDVLPEHVTSMMSFRTHGAVDGHPPDGSGRRPGYPGTDPAAPRRGHPGRPASSAWVRSAGPRMGCGPRSTSADPALPRPERTKGWPGAPDQPLFCSRFTGRTAPIHGSDVCCRG